MASDSLSPFEKTRIQMEYVVPMIRGLQQVLGADVVNDALRRMYAARVAVAKKKAPPASADAFTGAIRGMDHFSKGGAAEFTVTEHEADRCGFDVTRCQYAEMMKEMNAQDLGTLLLCEHDFYMAAGNGLELQRSQTIMEGCVHCDFRFRSLAEG